MTPYFAYGSNMGICAMRARCPGARAVGAARLDGWRFIIMRGGYASAVRSPGSAVHGVLWQLTPRDLAALNAYENLDAGLYLRRTVPVRSAAALQRAVIYLGHTRQEGRPDPAYQADIVEAARNWRFPAGYLAELRRWSPGGWRGAAKPQPGEAA